MTRPLRRLALALTTSAVAALAIGCEEPIPPLTSAFARPVDFAYACEGEGQTVLPVAPLDETTEARNDATRCPPVTQGTSTTQGDLFGLVVNQATSEVVVIQLNPASGTRRVLDASAFVPGFSGIPVAESPIAIARAADASAFYVVSAGERAVTRIVIHGFDNNDRGLFDWSATRFDLPGLPAGALVLGPTDAPGTLYVSSANGPELWAFDLTADPAAPPLTRIPTPTRVQALRPLPGPDGDELLVTWVDRPVLSRMAPDGTLLAEAGIAPACSDTLDNDGDGLTDGADPGCWGAADDDEGGIGRSADADLALEPPAFFGGADLCEDGLDNDLDARTDSQDALCDAGDADGETVPQCADGIDNDLDGLTDLDDPACFGAGDLFEVQPGPFGPFIPTVVATEALPTSDIPELAEARTFVYVLDQNGRRIAVFERAGEGFARVNVPLHEATAPAIPFVPYGTPTGPVDTLPAVQAVSLPQLAFQGVTDLQLPGPNLLSLVSSRVRGQLWTRIIADQPGTNQAALPLGLGDGSFTPTGCEPGRTDQGLCWQPPGDDFTWFVFGTRLDGAIQLIRAVFRGVPFHRFADRVTDPAARRIGLSRPRLTLRGRNVTLRGGSPPEGFAFPGPLLEERLSTATGELPDLFRRFGFFPPTGEDDTVDRADLERVLTETWTLTYEGVLPGTDSALGRMLDDTTFFAPNQRFCTHGVQENDWLVLTAAPETLAPELRRDVQITTADGEACVVRPAAVNQVEVRITAVGLDRLTVDPATARLVPNEPVLDEDAIRASGVSLQACRDALEALRLTLGRPDNLIPTDAFTPANLPRRLLYGVRGADAWVVVGSRSGYLHRRRWDPDAEACVTAAPGDPNFAFTSPLIQGRITESTLTAPYTACPVPTTALTVDAVDALGEGDDRFENFSFEAEIFPGCEITDDGEVTIAPSQRDTRWTFETTGPEQPADVRLVGTGIAATLGTLDFERQLLQLDTSGNRVNVLDFDATGLRATFTPSFE